jgi:serine/threonine protein kinase
MARHDLAGSELGVNQLQERLGVGGTGEVYRARDTRLNRTVAIKVLPSHRDGDAHWRERRHALPDAEATADDDQSDRRPELVHRACAADGNVPPRVTCRPAEPRVHEHHRLTHDSERG